MDTPDTPRTDSERFDASADYVRSLGDDYRMTAWVADLARLTDEALAGWAARAGDLTPGQLRAVLDEQARRATDRVPLCGWPADGGLFYSDTPGVLRARCQSLATVWTVVNARRLAVCLEHQRVAVGYGYADAGVITGDDFLRMGAPTLRAESARVPVPQRPLRGTVAWAFLGALVAVSLAAEAWEAHRARRAGRRLLGDLSAWLEENRG